MEGSEKIIVWVDVVSQEEKCNVFQRNKCNAGNNYPPAYKKKYAVH